MKKFKIIIIVIVLAAPAVVVIVSGLVKHHTMAIIESDDKKPGNAVGQALSQIVHQQMHNFFTFPNLSKGKIEGGDTQVAKLLAFIFKNYQKMPASDVRNINYSSAYGIEDVFKAAKTAGHFQMDDKPVASYYLAIGDKVAT